MNNNSRRSFISRSAVLATGMSMGLHKISPASQLYLSDKKEVSRKRPIHAFTKALQFLNYTEMAEVMARLGFAGADLTVREGGQVLPENVEKDLPKAVKALRDAGVDSYMITTNVYDADDKFTRPILKTMADLGIKYYRTGYLSYDHTKSMADRKSVV